MPFTRKLPDAAACATSEREKPPRCATTRSARFPASSGSMARRNSWIRKTREDQQDHTRSDARVGDVEDIRPDPVKIDEIDHVLIMNAIDDIADRAAENHTERDTDGERAARLIAKREPEDGEHNRRHGDQQRGRIAEEPERAVLVLLVGPAQQARNDE